MHLLEFVPVLQFSLSNEPKWGIITFLASGVTDNGKVLVNEITMSKVGKESLDYSVYLLRKGYVRHSIQNYNPISMSNLMLILDTELENASTSKSKLYSQNRHADAIIAYRWIIIYKQC